MQGGYSRPGSNNSGLLSNLNMGTPQQPLTSRRKRQYIRYAVIAVLLIIVIVNWRTEVEAVDAVSPYTLKIEHKDKTKAAEPVHHEDDVTEENQGKEDSTKEKDDPVATSAKPSDSVTSLAAGASHANLGAKPKIAIVTFTTGEKSYTYLSLRNKNAYAKKHDNIDLVIDYEAPEQNGVGIMWHKLTMMEDLIKAGTYDWIWWIDFDTLITNLNIGLHDIVKESLYSNVTSVFPPANDKKWKTQFKPAQAEGKNPDEIDFLLTADCFPLNAGSMLVRGRPAPGSSRTSVTSAEFFKRVRKYHKDMATYENQLSEQDCIRDLVGQDKKYSKQHVHMIPQWKMNAFPEEIRCWDKDDRGWEEGTFAIHFAGAWAHVKGDDPTGQMMRKYESKIKGEPGH